MRGASLALLALLSFATASFGREYYVAPSGSDVAEGTKSNPFRTIQKAAGIMKPGDCCIIAPGIYRETVTPKLSGTQGKPIAFRASRGEAATIIGTDPVRKWTKHSGHIYKAKMNWSLGKNNQIFIDGRSMQEARWPNDRDRDPMTPDGMKIGGGDVDHILCPQFPADWQPEDLQGAVVWAIPGSAWSSWTTTVSNFDPQSKKVLFSSFKGKWWVEARHNPKSRKGTFYLVGALKLLDSPGEWFYDEAAKMLYLWAPENADPGKLRVAAKARQLGLDLTGLSWITVDGLHLQGCSIDLEKASHCLIKNTKAHYISHTRGGKTVSSINEKSGIYIGGHHNRLVNCEIAYSAGSGVSLRGSDNSVINCWIHHIDYIGAYCSPVNMAGMRHLVSHNTIEYTGRDCIKLGGAEHLIQFNDIGFPGRICHDLGAIYSAGLDGGNTRIRYNYVHDNPGGGANVGIYLDSYMKNYIVDHNVVWNVGNGIRLNRPTGFCMVLNNTVFKDINNSWGPWKGQNVQWGCHVMNNLSTGALRMNPEVVTHANINQKGLTGTFNMKKRTRGSENPGKGRGIPIEGITPAKQVDVGAYQYDAPTWRAGHDFKTPPKPAYTPADEPLRNYIKNAAFEYGSYSKGTHVKVDPLAHWTKTDAATAVVEHHKGFNSPPATRNSIHGNSVAIGGDGDNGIEQVITGLFPNTTYHFSGYAKHAEDVNVEFGVQLSKKVVTKKSSQTVKMGGKQTWRFVHCRFGTGPNDASATVTIVKRGPGIAYIDNTGVVPATYGVEQK